MLASALVSIMIGAALARRFKVLILAPAFLLTLVLALATGLVRSNAPWSIASTALVVIIGLQLGYLLGIAVRHVSVLSRAHRLRSSSSLAHDLPPRRPAH